jgi:thioredoxin reductase (NADPH)
VLKTSAGTVFDTGAVVLAAGVGSFQPRRFGVPGSEVFEDVSIHYRVRTAAAFSGQRLAVFGGGDSALDWALALAPAAQELTLVHRREEFRAAPASVARMRALESSDKLRVIHGLAESVQSAEGRLSGVTVRLPDGARVAIEAQSLLVFFGLHPKLGPIAQWGLAIEKKSLPVDTEKFQTSVPGIFAVGDINTYPGKKKLILSGFHEAALAAFAIQHHLYPAKKQFLQYTTTSPIMHKRLGVPD